MHEFVRENAEVGEHLLPYCHQIVALLKRWLLGIHQGAVFHEHLDCSLDEHTFRFNRRTFRHCWKLFYRLLRYAIQTDSIKYNQIFKDVRGSTMKRHNI